MSKLCGKCSKMRVYAEDTGPQAITDRYRQSTHTHKIRPVKVDVIS